MTVCVRLLLLFPFMMQWTVQAASHLDDPMKLTLIRHEPCKWIPEAKWSEIIVFPDSQTAKLHENPNKPGCYMIGGGVNVTEDVTGTVQIHAELRYDAKEREQCYEQKSNGCGGFGSCLYCNPCDNDPINHWKNIQPGQKKDSRVQIYENGQAVDCRRGLKKGLHKNMYLHFCLPSKRSFLKNQGFNEETWDSLFNDKYNTDHHNKFGIFLILRIYNSKVSYLMAQEHKKAKTYRSEKNLTDDALIPDKVLAEWPFTKLLDSNRGFISCHKIFGNIRDD